MEYETLKSEFIDHGRNKFIEVSKKRVLPDGDEFINISKGYYTHDGEKRYQGGIGFPVKEKITGRVVEALLKLKEEQ